MATGPEFTQARIRVNQEGATELQDALALHEERLTAMRKLALDEGFTELIPVLNRKLGSTRRVIEETARTQAEQDW